MNNKKLALAAGLFGVMCIYLSCVTPGPSKYPTTGWQSDYDQMLRQNYSEDVFQQICPKATSGKFDIWIKFWKSIAYQESSFNRLERYQEKTLGLDRLTGLPVWSEGLFQLSYQDHLTYPACQFNWDTDQKLAPTDPAKQIFDPQKQMDCVIAVSKYLISKHRPLSDYWSSARVGSDAMVQFLGAYPECTK